MYFIFIEEVINISLICLLVLNMEYNIYINVIMLGREIWEKAEKKS